MRAAVPLVAAATAVLTVAGCALPGIRGREAADPVAPAGGTAAPAAEPERSASAPPSVTGALDPCALLTDDDKQDLGLSREKAKVLGRGRVCAWRHEGPSIRQSLSLQIVIFDDLTPDDLNPLERSEKRTFGTHDAVVGTTSTGSCFATFEIGGEATVETQAVSAGGEAFQCEWAAKVAERLEPNLP
jgi:hypothetical protein